MWKLLQYYGKYQSARGVLGGMPGWAQVLVLLAALPGIALILLSLLAFGVSILALLLLTVPVYRILKGLTGEPASSEDVREQVPPEGQVDFVEPEAVTPSVVVETVQEPSSQPQRERRQIEVRIIE